MTRHSAIKCNTNHLEWHVAWHDVRHCIRSVLVKTGESTVDFSNASFCVKRGICLPVFNFKGLQHVSFWNIVWCMFLILKFLQHVSFWNFVLRVSFWRFFSLQPLVFFIWWTFVFLLIYIYNYIYIYMFVELLWSKFYNPLTF
jgi:hypothetical protein